MPQIDELKKCFARETLEGFIRYTMPDYSVGWLHREICARLDAFLMDCIAGKSPRLMLTVPPRHGKSEIASRRFPAYILGRFPDLPIIATSYSSDLSNRMSRDVQRIICSDAYRTVFPETRLPERGQGARTADFFEIYGHKGTYRSAGVGGGLTGMGALIGLIDDPIKDRASADSRTIRDTVWDWYTSTFYTRLAPGGGIVVINTRWHADDLSGRLLERQADGTGDVWEVVNFPAIAEQEEPHRHVGEALHPERYPLDLLHRIKAAIGSRDWEALYQQHPTIEGGAIFKEDWFRYWLPKDLPSHFDGMVLSWDMTFKDSDTSDFVVGQCWGKKGADFFLLDQVRGRWGFTETVEQFRKLAAKWPQAVRKLVEDKANGPAVIDILKHEISGIIPIEPDGSKTARAHACTALFESGNVYIPSPQIAPWVNGYVLEMTQFPTGAHDDVVDASSQAIRFFNQSASININANIIRTLQRHRLR